ncbi:MAG: aminoacyl-tRNA hydrolase [Candidatus Infernicultor aquiphilus]|uniref:Peptidyl-tRNA hydrolase n=2 Tax=Candidatus Infernicultor aquiphilus TaxID=1805029 RepID=A0A1J5GHC9_9BACT|nr:aminoacyl-tRNA hydrolase [bacterium]OIP72153.1 MAG: aminoacyl-tRNA hydrolase [Candidatus Atribacteria bacterium CG2_30_33_13]PIU24989.1 MAG: aminoacyl-tRNA hydrolase [Candidatus Atribacteria bacterium CG08_land_8_20_14_0_20_33_29]PIW11731.1 MAG: aminoacyl-tRNA hydrolase [Candidatus Atribacteria bacterium CG17_big_fil_post_rev_8_21_14_2_50_34_11]PIX33565.1 MAG: aminoacyl-tRNA hydrolase [Candidatus Atribacteria bacterium CG_4_8_14_3_um_filter_34_18]PIY31381.1 MAG: aminoacyl-tRNA hydrolase [Ca
MKMVVGLGNPGLQYEFSRHNIGFRIIDNLALNIEIEFKRVKSYDSLVSRGKLMNHKLILVKPQTYMNLSGKSVSKIVSYYRISFPDLLIVYDDLNLELGQIRIRKRGSAGGHKGVESIIQYLNSEDIPRLRIGIGKPSINSNFDYASYVLSNFNNNEKDKISEVIQLSTEAIKTVIEDGLEKAMRKYNRKLELS